MPFRAYADRFVRCERQLQHTAMEVPVDQTTSVAKRLRLGNVNQTKLDFFDVHLVDDIRKRHPADRRTVIICPPRSKIELLGVETAHNLRNFILARVLQSPAAPAKGHTSYEKQH